MLPKNDYVKAIAHIFFCSTKTGSGASHATLLPHRSALRWLRTSSAFWPSCLLFRKAVQQHCPPSPAPKVSEHLVYHGKTKYRSMCLPCIFEAFSWTSPKMRCHVQGIELKRKWIVGFSPPLAARPGGQRCGGAGRPGWGWRWISSKDRGSPSVTCSIKSPALLLSTRDTVGRDHLHSFKSTEQGKPADGHPEVALALKPPTKPRPISHYLQAFYSPKAVSTMH